MARRDVVGGMRASCILASAAARSIANLLNPLNLLSQPARHAAANRGAALPVEPLEQRRMLASVNLSGGILSLTGNNGMRNTMTVMRSGTSNYVAKVGSLSRTISASSVSEIRITGGNWNDTITIDSGITKKSLIKGMDGNDSIKGGGGADTIYGGAYNDTLFGNGGNDWIFGEAGNDRLDGGAGTDKGDGGTGTDSLIGFESTGTTAPAPTTGLTVTGFQLWDANGNRFIRNINAGDTIDLATLPSTISVRATTSGAVASVKFGLDSNSSYRVESLSPWTISGDNGAKPNPLNLSLGSHTIKATPYSKNGATGSAGATRSVTFTVKRSAGTTPGGSLPGATSITVTSLQLWNSGSNSFIKNLTSGETLDLAKLPSTLTVLAQTSGTVKSVKFALDSNASYRTENGAPWSISGDISGDIVAWNVPTGSHTIKATPYTSTGGTGTAGVSKSVSLNITRSSTSTPTPPPPTDSGSSTGTGGITPRNSSAAAPNAVITAVSGTTIHAGQSFHANAMSSALNNGTPITARYVWDFGDSGSKYNVMQGFNASHFYSRPGTYTVKLTLTNEAGKTDTATMTVNVQSEGRKKIYVATDGNDANDGLSESKPIKTWSKAISKLADNVEILFKGGQTFDAKTSMNVYRRNAVIGSYGSGKATIKYSGARDYSSIIHLGGNGYGESTVENLVFDSIYTGADKSGLPHAITVGGRGDTIINNEFRNLGYAINTQSAPDGVLVQDNDAPVSTGLRGYFAWVAGDDLTFVGNWVTNVDGHVIRMAGVNRINVSNNDFTNPNETSGYRGTLTIHKGQYAYVANNKLTDGWFSVGPLGAADGLNDKGARWKWSVFEGNVVNRSRFFALHGSEHTMFRNNVMTNNGGDWAIEIEAYNSQYGRGVVDVTIANNTVINTATKGNFIRVNGDVNGINLINNLYVAPNLITGTEGSAPVFVYDTDLSSFNRITGNVWPTPTITQYAQGGINYVYSYWSNANGYKTPAEWDAYGVVGTDHYQDVGFSTSTFAPSTSSVANGAGIVWAGVFTDMNGRIRSNSGGWTAGAVEV